MRDFLDNLIERHLDAALPIKPRLPSMFEPEISHGGWDIATAQTEKADRPVSTQVSIPTASRTVIEPVQIKAASAQSVHAGEEKHYGKAGLHESEFSPSRGETLTLSPSQERGEERIGEVNSERESGLNEKMDGVRYVRQQGRPEHASPNPQTHEKVAKQTCFMERVFSSPVLGAPIIPSTSQGRGQEEVRGRNHGLLKPSASLCAPVIPSRPEQSISKPEPVVNVTIGRIEVRATPPSTQRVKKPRSTPPVMTLDEYLQKRNKGDRQ